ncbi:Dyp-type peroxidase [Rhodococcus sp. 27YEA15]|uniref:Dyp-type peroxidase n=1 Tax=Rhodococcus sp. 27YEA15 TaxID=3156259 RepID=UPI003C7A52DD
MAETSGIDEADAGSPATPQPLLTPLTEAAIFLVLTIDEGGEQAVHDVLADVSGLERSIGFRVPAGGLATVVGIGSDAWDRLFAGPRPAELHPFVELTGEKHHAPRTPGDLLFHIRARQMDLCFEFASVVTTRLAGAATVIDEVHGFKYFEQRDLLGFVDGTENPSGRAAYMAVTVGDEDPEFAGSSYVIVQKYLHDMSGWNSLPVEEQEKAIGRSKLEDLEMDDETKPVNAHTALTVIEDESGEQVQILRDNMPFGHVASGEMGTYFIGYSASPAVTEQMLTNMFIGNPVGNHDRILDFSTAVTGINFFVPTADFLDSPPDLPDRLVPEASFIAPISDGSLGIGSLTRSAQ